LKPGRALSGGRPVAGIELWLAPPEAAAAFDPANLDDAGRAEWAALRSERRRRDWASSRALSGAIGNSDGRPRSLSHSRGHAALAVSPVGTSPGVDVEWLAPRNYRGMAGLVFAPSECRLLDRLEDPGDRRAAFYELWTLKEAFAKALGFDFLDALRRCRFVDAGLQWSAEVPTRRCWTATVFAPRPGLRLALVCAADRRESLDLRLDTFEWPPTRCAGWPIVRELAGGGVAHA